MRGRVNVLFATAACVSNSKTERENFASSPRRGRSRTDCGKEQRGPREKDPIFDYPKVVCACCKRVAAAAIDRSIDAIPRKSLSLGPTYPSEYIF